jgi:hypothetical protein
VVAGRKAGEVAGKSAANQVPERAVEKAARDKRRQLPHRKNITPAAVNMIAAVIPTTTRDNEGLGWPFVRLVLHDSNRMPTTRNGARTPLTIPAQRVP